MQASAQPMHELENRNRLGLDDAFHHQLAGGIQYRDRDRVLVNNHSDILRAFHRRVLLSGGEMATAHSLVQGGTFLYCVAFSASSKLIGCPGGRSCRKPRFAGTLAGKAESLNRE